MIASQMILIHWIQNHLYFLKMKKITFIFFSICFSMLYSISVTGQNTEKQSTAQKIVEEEEGPIMFKFEPDYINKNKKKKAEIAFTRSIIDTLDISERKRLKLIRDLYKNGISKRLQKAVLVENTYEDIEE